MAKISYRKYSADDQIQEEMRRWVVVLRANNDVETDLPHGHMHAASIGIDTNKKTSKISRPGLVKPLGIYPLGPRSSSCGPTKGTPRPRITYVPTEVKPLQVDGLARIPGLRKPHTYTSSATK